MPFNLLHLVLTALYSLSSNINAAFRSIRLPVQISCISPLDLKCWFFCALTRLDLIGKVLSVSIHSLKDKMYCFHEFNAAIYIIQHFCFLQWINEIENDWSLMYIVTHIIYFRYFHSVYHVIEFISVTCMNISMCIKSNTWKRNFLFLCKYKKLKKEYIEYSGLFFRSRSIGCESWGLNVL